MTICTAVVGAGRKGPVIAGQLPKSTRKIIIDIDLQWSAQVARNIGGEASDALESAAAADLVPENNRIGSAEGIRAAVRVRRKLSRQNIPRNWIDTAIRTVSAGTLKAFVDDDLGDVARELAEKVEREMAEG